MYHNQRHNLNEGLRSGDLNELVSNLFTIDCYKSKMGEDKDIAVLGFRIKDKHPAIDLMEFIEKGYNFVLDADMSAGEEHDGQYQVFVEIERSPQLSEQIKSLLNGLTQLTKNKTWEFKYQKSKRSIEFSKEAINEHVPLTPERYLDKIVEIKTNDLQEFFNKGAVEISLNENNVITFKKPYAGNIEAKFVAIGNYESVKHVIPGRLHLDEQSQSQVLFLTKFLGNYDIDKIDNKFLIRNGDNAIVIEKNKW